jgi:hypothetical protein
MLHNLARRTRIVRPKNGGDLSDRSRFEIDAGDNSGWWVVNDRARVRNRLGNASGR